MATRTSKRSMLLALATAACGLELVSDDVWAKASDHHHVNALLHRAPAAHRRRCESVLRGADRRGFSQAWQDWILYRNFFAGQTGGLYVDIGTNDPLRISNTAFFDLCLGWRGVCFEPQDRYHASILGNRSCALVPRCVLGKAANVSVDREGGNFRVREARGGRAQACLGMQEALQGLALHGQTIDLLSIDIEGAEPHVLRCMPFEALDIRVILIETNKVKDMRAVDAFFHAHGYANYATLLQTDRTWLDNLYVRVPRLQVPGSAGRCSAEDVAQTDCHGDGEFQPWAHESVNEPWGRCEG